MPLNPASAGARGARQASTAGQLRRRALEAAARRSPFANLPLCLGGTQSSRAATVARAGAEFVKSELCPTCPFDASCPGAPRSVQELITDSLASVLRPLPTWYAHQRLPRVVILSSPGQDPVYYASTLPGLAHALRRRGVPVEVASPWFSRWSPTQLPGVRASARDSRRFGLARIRPDKAYELRWKQLMSQLGGSGTSQGFVARVSSAVKSAAARWSERRAQHMSQPAAAIADWLRQHDLSDFDLVIASDLSAAQLALATGRLASAARLVVPDFHMLRGMDDFAARWVVPPARPHEGGWWPSTQLVLESPFPGYASLYTNYGIPLEQVAWRPFALYPGHFPPGPDVNECRVIMSGGNHLRDLETLRLATERLPGGVHPVLLYDQGERFEGNAHLLHEGEVSLRSFYHAIAHSRFVVVPLREEVYRAAGVTVVAMALGAGRPVVATSIAATRDYIQDGTDGLLVPPGDPSALADAIARLDTDTALLSRLAAGARDAGRRLTTEYWADQIVGGRALHPVWTPRGWRSW